jgi:phosphatidylethanolamine/phosphatidyl-N-methylethanolamine N-methyltransferase
LYETGLIEPAAQLPGDNLIFVSQFLRSPHSVGALAPSSCFLARTILAAADLKERRVIVEFGPGTGAFTKHICAQLGPDQRYVGIEQNYRFARLLRLRYPHLTFVNDSVEELERIGADLALGCIDAIICGLPWASLPMHVQEKTFTAMRSLIGVNSVFCTFAYLQGLVLPGAGILRRRLKAEFREVSCSPPVWRNLPPAIVYACRQPVHSPDRET